MKSLWNRSMSRIRIELKRRMVRLVGRTAPSVTLS